MLEALQNTAEYASAAAAFVHLTENHGSLHLTVGDDVVGFDAATTSRGAGLDGMADRPDTVGGHLEVESAPASGTIIRGTVPVPLRATDASDA